MIQKSKKQNVKSNLQLLLNKYKTLSDNKFINEHWDNIKTNPFEKYILIQSDIIIQMALIIFLWSFLF